MNNPIFYFEEKEPIEELSFEEMEDRKNKQFLSQFEGGTVQV